jgi:hypothetical protein
MADTITGNCCECGLEIDYDPLVRLFRLVSEIEL